VVRVNSLCAIPDKGACDTPTDFHLMRIGAIFSAQLKQPFAGQSFLVGGNHCSTPVSRRIADRKPVLICARQKLLDNGVPGAWQFCQRSRPFPRKRRKLRQQFGGNDQLTTSVSNASPTATGKTAQSQCPDGRVLAPRHFRRCPHVPLGSAIRLSDMKPAGQFNGAARPMRVQMRLLV